jgi:hypothetical protein
MDARYIVPQNPKKRSRCKLVLDQIFWSSEDRQWVAHHRRQDFVALAMHDNTGAEHHGLEFRLNQATIYEPPIVCILIFAVQVNGDAKDGLKRAQTSQTTT